MKASLVSDSVVEDGYSKMAFVMFNIIYVLNTIVIVLKCFLEYKEAVV